MSPSLRLSIRLSVGLGLLLLTTALASSCTQDFDQFFAGPATTGATGGSGGTGGASGGGGSGGACAQPEDCPGLTTTCSYPTCTANQCGVEIAPAATPCTELGGQVCDGAGNCVECSTADQCEADEQCQGNRCVPLACSNNVQDGSETAIDCGGAECAPCALGLGCLVYSDCESWFCDVSGAGGAGGAGATGVCAACGNDGDCTPAPDAWCDSANQGGTCTPQKQDGDICSAANECLSGHCPSDDGVCCADACGATCNACLQGKTGVASGTCAPVEANTDPDGECSAAQPSTCGSNGDGCTGSSASCILYDDTTVCMAQSCTGSTLATERQCDGSGTCEPGALSPCAPYVCNLQGTDCRSSCSDDAHCSSGNYCEGSSCVAQKTEGDPCGDDGECQSGFCVDGFCCDQACSSVCLACSAALTGGSNGTCAATLANCTCLEQYTHGNIHELCSQNANECELRVSAQGASCNDICAAGGGECLSAVNDEPDGTCSAGANYGCGTTGFSSILCRCSRGCGGGDLCVPPDTCSGGTCQ